MNTHIYDIICNILSECPGIDVIVGTTIAVCTLAGVMVGAIGTLGYQELMHRLEEKQR